MTEFKQILDKKLEEYLTFKGLQAGKNKNLEQGLAFIVNLKEDYKEKGFITWF